MAGRQLLNAMYWPFAETSMNQLNRLPKSTPSRTSNEEPFQNATISKTSHRIYLDDVGHSISYETLATRTFVHGNKLQF